jgi:3-oxoacyl-[acyl-carrier protein] reductase
MSDLSQKIAIVTGGAQGLGGTISLGLAKEMAVVIIADINIDRAKQVIKEIKKYSPFSMAMKVDVSKRDAVKSLIKKVIQRYKGIDILINNAGICPRTRFSKITEKEWDRVLAVNLKSIFLLCQAVLPWMKKKHGGVIINIASAAGKIGGLGVGAHYAASKAGVICLTKSLALEGAPWGIRVNAIAPGVIDSGMTKKASYNLRKRYKASIPLGFLGSSDDVAKAVVFLASENASYITGEILDVNGGFVMD